MLCQLQVTGREWCDLAQYCSPLGSMRVERFSAPPDEVEGMRAEMAQFCAELDELGGAGAGAAAGVRGIEHGRHAGGRVRGGPIPEALYVATADARWRGLPVVALSHTDHQKERRAAPSSRTIFRPLPFAD